MATWQISNIANIANIVNIILVRRILNWTWIRWYTSSELVVTKYSGAVFGKATWLPRRKPRSFYLTQYFTAAHVRHTHSLVPFFPLPEKTKKTWFDFLPSWPFPPFSIPHHSVLFLTFLRLHYQYEVLYWNCLTHSLLPPPLGEIPQLYIGILSLAGRSWPDTKRYFRNLQSLNENGQNRWWRRARRLRGVSCKGIRQGTRHHHQHLQFNSHSKPVVYSVFLSWACPLALGRSCFFVSWYLYSSTFLVSIRAMHLLPVGTCEEHQSPALSSARVSQLPQRHERTQSG